MASKTGKRYSPKFKFNVVLEALKSEKSDAEVVLRSPRPARLYSTFLCKSAQSGSVVLSLLEVLSNKIKKPLIGSILGVRNLAPASNRSARSKRSW